MALIGAARGQDGEFDRQVDPGQDRERGAPSPAPPPPAPPIDPSGRPVPDQGLPPGERDPRFVPEPFDPTALPPPGPRREEAAGEPSLWEKVQLRWEGRVRLGAGHDSNVFRSQRGRTADGFGHAQGEAELLLAFPQGAEVFLELSAETQTYFERHRANEHFGAAFLDVFQPLLSWLDVGGQLSLELSRQNLLDDNGDLFPRGRFGSADVEPRAYAILRPHADLALELGASQRWKDYEENRGVDSLDYREVRLDAAFSWKVARQPRARLKLKYRFRRRDYREFRARERDGTVDPFAPNLDLFRHQLTLTWYQELTLGETDLRLIASAGLAYNHDLHENDRSYREGSVSLRAEWWLIREMTRVEGTLRLLGRDFVVRRPDDGSGGHLRHRLLDATVTFWQRLGPSLPLAVYVTGSATVWDSRDLLEDYERFIVEGGLELFW